MSDNVITIKQTSKFCLKKKKNYFQDLEICRKFQFDKLWEGGCWNTQLVSQWQLNHQIRGMVWNHSISPLVTQDYHLSKLQKLFEQMGIVIAT